MFKILLVFLVSTLFSLPCFAATITLKRGVGLDTWVTWPDVSTFHSEKVIQTWPEWRNENSPKQLLALKEAGFDFVRIGFEPSMWLAQTDDQAREQVITRMKEAIAEAKTAGLKVVIDLHTIPRNKSDMGIEHHLKSTENFKRYMHAVYQLGTTIAGEDPAQVAFEPINEPTIDCPWHEPKTNRWPAMALLLHQTARAAAPKLAIIMQGACWGGSLGLSKLDPAAFRDGNTIWSFHHYEPLLFTHQGASWFDGPATYVTGLKFPADPRQKSNILKMALQKIHTSSLSAARKKSLKRQLRQQVENYFEAGAAEKMFNDEIAAVAAWAKLHEIKADNILVGEFGVIESDQAKPVPTDLRSNYLKFATRAFDNEGWGWSVWSWGGSFRITSDDESRTLTPGLFE